MAEPLSEHALETTLRVARVMFPHDMLPDIAYAKVVTALEPEAETAVETVRTPPYPATHNLGTARMSERPQDGVVNAFGQAHDVPNLFVSDGSQFTTGAAANPTLTIVALAIRQAEYIAEQLRSQAIPAGRQAWDGRDPGGSVPAVEELAA
jgi:choline dehydrogenase-like flavoprotein